MKKEFPILEFDSDENAFIRPEQIIQKQDISEKCVLCFFSEAIQNFIEKHPHRIVSYFVAESLRIPVYEVEYKGEKIALVQAAVGSPMACAQIEEITAMGCKKYIGCGSCGVLQHDIAVGHLIIPAAAVRDEGASYHYVAPSREIEGNTHAVASIEKTLSSKNVPFIKAKTWTTDAFYRETPAKIKMRKDEGCITVEMETSAYMAVAQYNNVVFGQILYAGDNLGGAVWDSRDFNKQVEIREYVLELAVEACLVL